MVHPSERMTNVPELGMHAIEEVEDGALVKPAGQDVQLVEPAPL